MWFESWCANQQVTIQRPNSMNNYGAILDDFGFNSFLNRLMTEYISPLSTLLFKDTGGDSLDEHHGFVVEYKMGKDVSLDFHSDDSDVTFNVCLGQRIFRWNDLFSWIALPHVPANVIVSTRVRRNRAQVGTCPFT